MKIGQFIRKTLCFMLFLIALPNRIVADSFVLEITGTLGLNEQEFDAYISGSDVSKRDPGQLYPTPWKEPCIAEISNKTAFYWRGQFGRRFDTRPETLVQESVTIKIKHSGETIFTIFDSGILRDFDGSLWQLDDLNLRHLSDLFERTMDDLCLPD